MNKIHKLPQELIDLIAAGEVVERPSSVVKELMENSIDAGSTKIIVKIVDSGNSLIEVEDNGSGMDKEDAQLAFIQHATSKINTIDDLNYIKSLGFRGEALASISSVSEKAVIDTKTSNKESVRVVRTDNDIKLENSEKNDIGTTIKIINLFNKVPARKKFLKSPKVELKHISNTFLNTSLPFLNIHFELWHNNSLMYKLTKVNNFLDRIFEVWGKNISSNLYEGIYANNNVQIKVFLGSTNIGRRSSDLEYIFVNNRAVSNKTIYSAALEGYRGFLHKDLKPVYFFFIDINPELVDVNIHPRKLEVRFNDSSEIFRSIYSLTKKKLEEESKSLFKSNILEGINTNLNNFNSSDSSDSFKPSDNYSKLASPSKGVYYSRGSQNSSIKEAIDFSRLLVGNTNDINTLDNSYESQTFLNNIKPFQLFNTYILIEKDNSIIFIDQHAASEKINFEKIYKSIGEVKTKPLLLPEIIELKPSEKDILLTHINDLKSIGILIEDFGFNSVKVLEIPESLNNLNINNYIQKILDSDGDISKSYLRDKSDYPNLTLEMYLMLATTACHGSIRAGQILNEIEMRNIVNDLLSLDKPNNCPHGRPVMWILDRSELEKNFNRKI